MKIDWENELKPSETAMKQIYTLITPEIALRLLKTTTNNRKISRASIIAYKSDMKQNFWDENVGSGISIDSDGILRDGQHRCQAIVESGIPIHMWVCLNVSPTGIYDSNRPRRAADQILISNPNYESFYKSTRWCSIASVLICGSYKRKVSSSEIDNYVKQHKEDLDKFFLVLPQKNAKKISISLVQAAMFMGFCDGVSMEDIEHFYDILCSGMASDEKEHPIIAYRNYLTKVKGCLTSTVGEIGRCQYALSRYISGSCIKKSIAPNELIYPFPYKEKEE